MNEALFLDKLSDEELAVRAQAGSRSYFEELVSRYCQRLFLFLRSRLGTDQDAEDLVQETFLKVYKNLHRFNRAYKFSTWLYTTASRLVISFYRKNRSRHTQYISASVDQDPQDTLLHREDSQNLWNTARTLPPLQFQALWLRYVEDMTPKDIGRVMKKSQVHVRVILHRARLKLIKTLNPAAGSEDKENSIKVQKAAAGKNFSFL